MIAMRQPGLLGSGALHAGFAVLRIPLLLLRVTIDLIMFGLGLFLIAELWSGEYASVALEATVLIVLGAVSVSLRRLSVTLRR